MSFLDGFKQIIRAGAASSLTEKAFFEKELMKFKASKGRKDMLAAERYYLGDHDIRRRKRTIIGADGLLVEVENLPNNRIVDNQYAKLVDQKINYFLGQPLTIDSENETYRERLKLIFDKSFHRKLKNLGKNCLNHGLCWLHPYYDLQGELRFKVFNGFEVLPFWADSEHTELEAAIRVYSVDGYEGQSEVISEFVEIYRSDGIYKYELRNKTLIPDAFAPYKPYVTVRDGDEEKAYNWQRIPLIAFKYTPDELPLLNRVKSLQDALNASLSDYRNNMQEDARNTILVLKNYDGTNLGEFRRNLATFGAVKVKTIDGADGGLDTLTVDLNSEAYKYAEESLRKAIIDNGRGYDASELRSSGTPNEMNIKSIFNDIDLDANGLETEFQSSLEQLLWFLNVHFANTGQGNFDGEEVNFIFNRDTIVSESAVITDIQNSVGILSSETLVSQHPWVSDVQQELKRVEEEQAKKQAELDEYRKAFAGAGGNEE